jgi:hypothetical protein
MNTRAKHRSFRSARPTAKFAAAALSSAADAPTHKPNSGVMRAPLTLAAERRKMILEAAYYLAQQRGFEPGHEVEDWLLAESQIDISCAGAGLAPADGF